MMIDAHHHLWQYSQAEYPWIPEGSALAGDHVLEQLHAATAEAGVTGTVVVQARQCVEETRWLCGLVEQSAVIRGVVGWLPLVDEGIEGMLDEWFPHVHLKGLRHVLQEEPDEYFRREDFHRGLAAMARRKVPYDLLIFEHQIPLGLELLDAHRELPMVLDHIAKPVIWNGKLSETWLAGMEELAKRENLMGVKISGMVTEVRDSELDGDTLRRYVDETLRIFGSERVMFGTDWPVSLLRTEDYAYWPNFVRSHLSALSAAEQAAVFYENAVRCYGL